ncbi:phosphoribosylamine--glycine ligase [bacterium]|nr:phosphoribosylamine--glycine ligase [bacterium]
MVVLIIGGGGREHTIAWKLKNEDKTLNIISIPGNGGMRGLSECVSLDIGNREALLRFALDNKVDYTIVGPEAPLAIGITDLFREKGLKIFGPDKEGAKLESSKIFAKNFMKKYNIKTSDFQVIDNYNMGYEVLQKSNFPIVLKYDGLAAGKGVKVAEDLESALDFLKKVYKDLVFGKDNSKVIIEEYLKGIELSYLIFTDTKGYAPMVPARDYKRVFDGNQGPNTGGMGCFSSDSLINEPLEEEIKNSLVIPTIEGLKQENIDYRGVLYFGLMLTEKGLYVLEYNVRFGDPETQVILPRMDSSLMDVIDGVINQRISDVDIKWSKKDSICVIMASEGYPGDYKKGRIITGLNLVKNAFVFHAGTDVKDGKLITSGGRVLGVTALDDTIDKARESAYKVVSTISFEGNHFRKDIGL